MTSTHKLELMKFHPLIFTALILALSGLTVLPGLAESNNRRAFVLCRNRKVVRTIRVEKKDDQFLTVYTKAGVDRGVGENKWYESAYKILSNIQKNLEGAGWNCSEVDNFKVTEAQSQ